MPLIRKATDLTNVNAVASGKPCHPIVCDITSSDAESRISQALESIESVDLLINNAGIPGRSYGLLNTTPEEVQSLVDVHAIGALRVCRATLPALLKTPSARIVNISSRLGSIQKVANGEFAGREFSYSYRIAKAAQNMLSACLAEELGQRGITVSVVHPGLFKSSAASSEARLSASEAATRIRVWIEEGAGTSLQYVEPGVGALPW